VNTNLGRWERIGSVAAGVGLLYVATRRASLRLGTQTLGAGLLARGLTGHCPVKRALMGPSSPSTDTRRRLGGLAGIHVRESVIVSRPVAEVYRFWRQFDNLSRFLEHVERVDVLDARRSHWVVRGPAGMRFEWDAEIISDDVNERIAWKSTESADVVSAGSVLFRPLGSEQTQIAVHLQYAPPGGLIGRGIASLLTQDPNEQIKEDLARLRTLLEQHAETDGPSTPASPPAGH